MVAKRITVSFSEGDHQFCFDKNLSPSKLLQERITQIRDEENPALREMIKEAQQKVINLTGKLNHTTGMLSKIIDAAQDEIPQKKWNKIIDKLI